MSLAAADVGMIGALVPQLETGLHIDNTDVGLLVTVSGLVAALGTLPFGILADRVPRLRLLALAVATWGVAELASAFAPTFGALLAIRVLLGALTAAAGPAVASLTGDFFPAEERGRMYGYILAGEVVGSGFGFLLAGLASSVAGWRAALGILSIPSIAVVYLLTHTLREPARGGMSRLQLSGTSETADSSATNPNFSKMPGRRLLRAGSASMSAQIDERRIPRQPPAKLSPWAAVRYALGVPTNALLIVASSLGYFYLNGLRTFAFLFIRGQYGLNQGVATVVVLLVGAGVLTGVLLGGRTADRLTKRRLTARLNVAAVGFLVGAVALAFGLGMPWLALSLPMYLIAAVAISAPNPPLDAARLDIIASGLWGRAESVRTLIRGVFESFAPLAFGIISTALTGAAAGGWGTGVNSDHTAPSLAESVPLRNTFLIMLFTLFGAGVLILRARRHYPRDILTAAEYEERSRAQEGETFQSGQTARLQAST
jgi:predicted MFS family arabinose efflux permease